MIRTIVAVSLLLFLTLRGVSALDFTLSVQPVLPKQQILQAYQPLAEYLSSQSGHNIILKGHSNFLAYWADMRRSRGFDLVLDAAPFTDYRVQKQGFQVLAKLPDTVSFSIVTHEDNLVFDIEELVLKKIATLVSPSVGAIRMLDLFPDPMRQPKIVYAKDSNDAAQMVMDKKVDAAIIPTALVGSYEGLNTVTTTEALPHMGFSASPKVPAEVRDRVMQALISAKDTPAGQAMLSKLNFTEFVAADNKVYQGYASLLKNVLGY